MKRNDDLTFEQYNTMTRWKNGRKFKVSKSYGTRDYLKHYNNVRPRNKKYSIKREEFSTIFSAVCQKMADEYLNTGYLTFPYYMGSISIYETDVRSKIVDGKLKIRKRVNWRETLRLWHEDKEAEKNKTLIYHEDNTLYSSVYERSRARYKNKIFYDFTIVRNIKKRISSLAKENKLPAFKRRKYD